MDKFQLALGVLLEGIDPFVRESREVSVCRFCGVSTWTARAGGHDPACRYVRACQAYEVRPKADAEIFLPRPD